jgi:hypothetical protein
MTARREVRRFVPADLQVIGLTILPRHQDHKYTGAFNHATADIAIFLMIEALLQAYKPLASIRASNWRGDFTSGRDPNKKILGTIGIGGIG